ncbi:hypothetical protein ABZ517_23195 [Streptomyces scabiei]|uniref:hypothetical protein n=1 Tax=Streptomyces scabiei TaxID=1930 RepID=UPI0034112528
MVAGGEAGVHRGEERGDGAGDVGVVLPGVDGRLADAIRDRALLPMWFVTVLGPVPPAHKTQEWMDLATQVLAYRVTYGITDQAVALGPAPNEYVPRRTEYGELTKDLRRW